MKLVIDDKIPFIHGLAEQLGTCVYRPGSEISPADVQDADALIVRTRTHANEALLKGSKVQLVVTATIGHDHLDKEYLAQAGIKWHNCPGCNAESVAQYVRNSLWRAMLAGHLSPNPQDTCVGIVGVGHVGSAVSRALRAEGFRTLHCDPPKGEPATLADLARECQVITLHTPLTTEGEHATFHLANAEFFASLRQCRVFINAARGECTDTQALKAAIRSGKVACAVIDTWENEPDIDRELLDLAFIATPHIAGYSADGKANGTRMSLQHVIDHFRPTPCPQLSVQAPNLPSNFDYAQEVISQLPASFSTSYPWLSPEITAILPHSASSQLQQYDALADTFRLRSAPNSFEFQRGHYPLRRE
ncbi:MAG: 4-phosphoerythronate dehydrogenase [Alloprevotella sp.]|nr:MAG: 4-phosphoerythronate dehydrogenase [Alloprevotella sp.]